MFYFAELSELNNSDYRFLQARSNANAKIVRIHHRVVTRITALRERILENLP